MKRINRYFGVIASLILAASFAGCNAELNTVVAEATINAQTEKNPPDACSEITALPGNESVELSWKNPTCNKDKTPLGDLYGVTISATCEDAEGSLGSLYSPVTFLKEDKKNLPESYTVNGLTNGKKYVFKIVAFDNNLNVSEAITTSQIPESDVNPNEVSNLKAVAGNKWVKLNWTCPDFTGFAGFYIVIAGDDENNGSITISKENLENYKDSTVTDGYVCQVKGKNETTSLKNDVSYTFTVKTILKAENGNLKYSYGKSQTASPSSGSEGIYASSNLFDYKKTLKAYDIGYHTEDYDDTLQFICSSDGMDISKSDIKSVGIGKGSFAVTSYKNTTPDADPDKYVLSKGDWFSITVTYKPSAEKSWDEANLIIGEDSANTIRLIGTNFATPKDITANEMRMWLRADMISKDDVRGSKLRVFPDYTANEFDAYCTDTNEEDADYIPSYAPNYVAAGEGDGVFNGFPYVDFSEDSYTQTSQLIVNASSVNPILNTTEGSTIFVIYKMDQIGSGYSIVSANNGTSFPTIYTNSRGYMSLPKGADKKAVDAHYGITIKANGMAGTNRWFSKSNEKTGINYLYEYDTTKDNVNTICAVHNGKIADGRYKNAANKDVWPSNLRGMINGDEKLLGYYYSLSTTTSKDISSLQNYTTASDKQSTNGITFYGSYGMPIGDGDGHRHGTLGLLNSVTFKNYTAAIDEYNDKGGDESAMDEVKLGYWNIWKDASRNVAAGSDPYCADGSRTFDYAYGLTPATNLGATSTKINGSGSGYYYYNNWIPKDIRKNGNITTFTLGPDFSTSSSTRIKVAEVIFFKGALSNEDIQKLNDYAAYKYKVINTNNGLETGTPSVLSDWNKQPE